MNAACAKTWKTGAFNAQMLIVKCTMQGTNKYWKLKDAKKNYKDSNKFNGKKNDKLLDTFNT